MLNKLFCLFVLASLTSVGAYADAEQSYEQSKEEQIVVTDENSQETTKESTLTSTAEQEVMEESSEATLADSECGCKKKKTDAKFACKKKRRQVLAHHDGEHEHDEDETHEETLASCCGNGCQSEEIKDEEEKLA